MNPDDLTNIPTSRPVAETPEPHPPHKTRETIPDHEVDPNVKNSNLPKGVDKPDGELESVNDDGKRVEKRTTM